MTFLKQKPVANSQCSSTSRAELEMLGSVTCHCAGAFWGRLQKQQLEDCCVSALGISKNSVAWPSQLPGQGCSWAPPASWTFSAVPWRGHLTQCWLCVHVREINLPTGSGALPGPVGLPGGTLSLSWLPVDGASLCLQDQLCAQAWGSQPSLHNWALLGHLPFITHYLSFPTHRTGLLGSPQNAPTENTLPVLSPACPAHSSNQLQGSWGREGPL